MVVLYIYILPDYNDFVMKKMLSVLIILLVAGCTYTAQEEDNTKILQDMSSVLTANVVSGLEDGQKNLQLGSSDIELGVEKTYPFRFSIKNVIEDEDVFDINIRCSSDFRDNVPIVPEFRVIVPGNQVGIYEIELHGATIFPGMYECDISAVSSETHYAEDFNLEVE